MFVCSPPWGTTEKLWVQVQTADTRLSGHTSHTPTQRSCESQAVGQSSVSCTHWGHTDRGWLLTTIYIYNQCESQAVDPTSMTAAPCSSHDIAITQMTTPQVPPNICLFRVLLKNKDRLNEDINANVQNL